MAQVSGALQIAIDRQVETTVAAMQVLASSPTVDQAAAASGIDSDVLAPFRSQAQALVEQRPSTTYNVVLYDLSGHQLVNTLVPPGVTLPQIDDAHSPVNSPRPVDARAVLMRIIRSRQPLVTNLFWGPVSKRYQVAVLVPAVRDSRVVAVLVADILPDSFSEVLRKQERPAGWVASLVDGTGMVIARSEDEARFVAERAAPAVRSFAEGPQEYGMVRTELLGGPPSYGALRRLTTARWVVGFGAPRDLINAPMWRSLAIVGGGGSLAIMFAGFAAWRIGRRLGRELESLDGPAAALAAGTPSAPSTETPSRVAEVQLVRRSLNKAADILTAREAALRSLNDSLETRVKAAIEERETARAQLLQAQKTEAIGQLTGGLAHDFNNLLAAIIGSLELLRKRIPADDVRALHLLENAFRGAQRGAALTQRLLAFGRRQTLNPEPVHLPALIQGMSDLLRSSLGAGIRIETHFAANLPAALVDANQLELALLNLAVNARDAMPDGGQLTISARAEPAGPQGTVKTLTNGSVVLSVIDTGEGMDEAMLARAVEPFFTTKGVGKGSGLGLSMVHGLAAQSGGSLMLRSRPKEGTTAELWLPRALNPALVGHQSEVTPTETAALELGHRTVLIVDDDPLVLMSTASMLEDLGFVVHEANSGEQALAILKATPDMDLVVTDQSMPGMTGVQLAAVLRQRFPKLPVLLATGYLERTDVAEAGLPLVGKPFNQASLADAIGKCLHGPGAEAIDFPLPALSGDHSAD